MTPKYLNYVGAGLYTIPVFEAEAKRVGVSRGIAARILKTISFGDQILLAQWLPNYEKQESMKAAMQVNTQKYFRVGNAEVFGHFAVTGISFKVDDADAQDRLIDSLTVVGADSVRETIFRMCGSAAIGTRYYVLDSIAQIVAAAKAIEKDMGVKFKWFVTGPYTSLGPLGKFTMIDAKFSRGVVKVYCDLPKESAPAELGEVSTIENYVRRSYVSKDDKAVAEREAGK